MAQLSIGAIGLLVATCVGQVNQWSEGLIDQLDTDHRRDSVVQRMDEFGQRAIVALMRSVQTAKPVSARNRCYAMRELAHHGADYISDLVKLETVIANELLPDVLEVEVAFLPFLDSSVVQAHVDRITRLVTRSKGPPRSVFQTRLWDSYRIAIQLGGSRVRKPPRSPLGVNLDTEVLVQQLGLPGLADRSEAAARLISRRRRGGAPAIKALFRVLRSRGPRFPILGGVQKDPEPMSHRWAAVAITKLSPRSRHSIEAHGYLLLFGNDREMRNAIRAIRLHSKHGKVAVPSLVKGLSDGDKWRRAFTNREKVELLITLGIIGKEAGTAIPKLEAYVGGPDRYLAKAAESALRSIRPARKRVIR